MENYIDEINKKFMEDPESVLIQAGLIERDTSLDSFFESVYNESHKDGE